MSKSALQRAAELADRLCVRITLPDGTVIEPVAPTALDRHPPPPDPIAEAEVADLAELIRRRAG